jgi:hypothetical protein
MNDGRLLWHHHPDNDRRHCLCDWSRRDSRLGPMKFIHFRETLAKAIRSAKGVSASPPAPKPQRQQKQERPDFRPPHEKVEGGIIKFQPVDRVAARVIAPAAWIHKYIATMTIAPTENIESRVKELETERSLLTLDKREHEVQLIAIKNVIRSGGLMPHEKYTACCNAQTKHSRGMLEIEVRLRQIKAELRELNCRRENACRLAKGISASNLAQSIYRLQNEYEKVADDTTRLQDVRDLAMEFVLKLAECMHSARNRAYQTKGEKT